MRRLYVRCDATLHGGVGHAMRGLAVAEAAIAAGWQVRFAGRIESPLVRGALDAAGIGVEPVQDAPPALVAAAAAAEADVLHVDSYTEFPGLHDAARAAGVLLSSMEDGEWGRRPADVVVDGHPRALDDYRPESSGVEVLAGPAFLPLRAAIAAAAERPPAEPGPLRRVLVLMGGTDAFGATDLVARLLAELPSRPAVRAVGATPQEGIESVPAGSLLDLLDGVDLVVTAGGTSVWELAALGVPMAVVQVTENQAENRRYLVEHDLAQGLGTLEELRSGGLASGVADALADRSLAGERASRARLLVDGRGAARIVGAWEDRLGATGVTVRPARAGDASALFDWRDDPATRAASRSTGALEWTSHAAWVRATLADPMRSLLIARTEGAPAGTVRFDRLDEGSAEISITLAPSARGRGLAQPVIAAAMAWLAAQPSPPRLVIAEMRPENGASQRAFRAAGFTGDGAAGADGMVRLSAAL
ncbi:bifunctional UDP-2,4-diacetamido-2,4,6-trideoxy-beta-L-altropyranose hydrolase/GNAT family N-acetyltransferase [Naasia sp. SYSU D00057]|uniref:bifunctional UDP-2,4-diacetamido-2,4,6-trideoxy-beta-L-altropyranose hydrolase/GNAT family N-acetyltransferase n=1 Tax=Naasia sp. SYSU D00057 TaxID=2817380 RepID=UPI001B30D4CC|nr:bifunctional UDP-2,4-diacetamido-2,4,6-trideoxy-beta-L-altropyranose hydrolase/GNAT family N-acetyltransferase [Naasia sp. SYSU D00057]